MIRTGMILAAGFGTRLRPLTRSIAKPMVTLCNRPLIGWALESMIESGIRDIVVNLHHEPRAMMEWLPAAAGDRARIRFTHEEEILGTGGGIRNARSLLEGSGQFALVNGDTVQKPPFQALAAARESRDAIAALLLRQPPSDDRFTPVYLDGDRVTGFGSGRGEALMFAGAHVISDRVFSWIPDRPFSGIVEHVYMPVLEQGSESIAGLRHDDWWFDIGTPRRLLAATRTMLSLILAGSVSPPAGSHIADGSLLAQTARGTADSSTLDEGCRMAPGSLVSGSVLMTGSSVGHGARLTDSILGPGTALPDGFEGDNVLLCVRRGDEEEGRPVADGSLVAVPIDTRRPHVAA